MCNPADLSQAIRNVLSSRRPKSIRPESGAVRRHAAVLATTMASTDLDSAIESFRAAVSAVQFAIAIDEKGGLFFGEQVEVVFP